MNLAKKPYLVDNYFKTVVILMIIMKIFHF